MRPCCSTGGGAARKRRPLAVRPPPTDQQIADPTFAAHMLKNGETSCAQPSPPPISATCFRPSPLDPLGYHLRPQIPQENRRHPEGFERRVSPLPLAPLCVTVEKLRVERGRRIVRRNVPFVVRQVARVPSDACCGTSAYTSRGRPWRKLPPDLRPNKTKKGSSMLHKSGARHRASKAEQVPARKRPEETLN